MFSPTLVDIPPSHQVYNEEQPDKQTVRRKQTTSPGRWADILISAGVKVFPPPKDTKGKPQTQGNPRQTRQNKRGKLKHRPASPAQPRWPYDS
ncbi:hypothetical protein CNYM01_06442 [Colletotrichum nymphaeae SA-01]|uniref:Uncharacterized protein n=1 Tax=Colletotrichum nymphaeae SA-01 TaxID=1460502 RepID=A0A135SBW0_9PEZI|nr:hypothetical protein CNYM01_06442 [Colletotrichum nymphaeae SA-01]